MTIDEAFLCKPQPVDGVETGAQATKTTTEPEKTEESSIRKEIDSGIRLTEEVAKLAAEKIAKENKERRVEETKTLIERSAYTRSKVLNRLQKSRDTAKAEKVFLTAVGALEKEVNSGKHDTTSFEEAFSKAYKERKKAYDEIDAEYRKYEEKLRQLYSNSWRYGWEYNL